MKTFLKILANALGAFGVAIALINPKALFGGEQPVSFVFLIAAVVIGLVAYFLPAPSRFPDVAVVAATLVLIAFALTRFSPIRSRLIVAEHLGSIPYLGLGDRADLYRPVYGPTLMRSEHVMAFHEGLLREFPDVETVVQDHGRYALVYAGRRLRGQTDDQIFNDPFGPRLFLGTLISETFEPYWWTTSLWLRNELALKPSTDWKMGLLPPAWAKAKFQAIAANPPKGDASMIEGLLYIALRRPEFASAQQINTMLDAWQQIRQKQDAAVDKPIAAARAMAAALAPNAVGGHLSVNFQYPETWSANMRAVFSADLLRFLQAGGIDARLDSAGTPIAVSASPRQWENVAYVFTDEQYKTVRQHIAGVHLGHGVYMSGRDTTTQVLEKTQKETRGSLGVPTLILRLRAGSQEVAYGFAPVDTISKERAEALWSCDPSKPRLGFTRESDEESLADLTLAPWRFGLRVPSEDNNRNKRSEEYIY